MYDGIKVFTATKQRDRDGLGETVTHWLNEKRDELEITETVVKQSSDSEYHCLSILLFYKLKAQGGQ